MDVRNKHIRVDYGYHDIYNSPLVFKGFAHEEGGAGLFHWLKKAVHKVGHGISHIAHSVEHGVSHLAHDVEHGVSYVGHGIEHGVESAGHAIGKAAVGVEHGLESAGKFVVKEGVKGLKIGEHWVADHIKDGLVDVGKFVAKNGLQILTDGGCAFQPELCEVFEAGSQALQKGVINPALDKEFSKLEDKATGAADKWLDRQGDKLVGKKNTSQGVKEMLQANPSHPANEFQRLDLAYMHQHQ